MRLCDIVLIVTLAIVNVLLYLIASNIVLSLMQRKLEKRNPTGLQTNTGEAAALIWKRLSKLTIVRTYQP
jgi:hypothetical protein